MSNLCIGKDYHSGIRNLSKNSAYFQEKLINIQWNTIKLKRNYKINLKLKLRNIKRIFWLVEEA